MNWMERRGDTLLSVQRVAEIKARWPGDLKDFSSEESPTDVDKLLDDFKESCFVELGVSEHPRRHELFSLAWELKHDEGLSSVFDLMKRLVDLVAPVDPAARWLDVEWLVDHVAAQCTGRRQRHTVVKALVTKLLDSLDDPSDD